MMKWPLMRIPKAMKSVCLALCLQCIFDVQVSSAFLTLPRRSAQKTSIPHSTSLLKLTATTNFNANPILVSPKLVNSAIDILEEQFYERPNVPMDSILRKYIKQSPYDFYDSDEKDALREILLGVGRNQYKLDWNLEQISVECTPERRVISHVALEDKYVSRGNGDGEGDLIDQLTKSHEWLEKLISYTHSDASNDSMELQTRLECPTWAWKGLQEAFPAEDDLTNQLNALLQPAPLDLRVNTLKCSGGRDGALQIIQNSGLRNAKATPLSPLGIRLDKRVPWGPSLVY